MQGDKAGNNNLMTSIKISPFDSKRRQWISIFNALSGKRGNNHFFSFERSLVSMIIMISLSVTHLVGFPSFFYQIFFNDTL
jgi:hypothetical protein